MKHLTAEAKKHLAGGDTHRALSSFLRKTDHLLLQDKLDLFVRLQQNEPENKCLKQICYVGL